MTPENTRRPYNLALIYQEVLTAIERFRANRQNVSDADSFRHHMREALKTASTEALATGYPADDVKLATFATVAFLDESILNSQNPVFADWRRETLQHELFGTFIAGELFFQNLQALLGRNDSPDLGDLIEVYYLCLVLGFLGKYSAGDRGELARMLQATAQKLRRIRGPFNGLAPSWKLPGDVVQRAGDPWVRKLGIIAGVAAGLMVVMFIIYKLVLSSGVRIV